MPGEEQVKDPEIDECFDWDPGYLMVDRFRRRMGIT